MKTLTLSGRHGALNAVAHGPLDGARPLALLLHGGHGSWRHWRANLDSLSQIVDPVAIDMPGYGESADAPSGLSLQDYAALIDDALSSLPPTSLVLGFSFGTLVAAELARRWQSRPDFRGVLLINPPLGPEVTSEVLSILDEGAAATRRGGLLAGVAVTQRRIMFADPERATPELIADAAEQVRRTRFKSRPLSRSIDIREQMRALRCPVYMLLGGVDPHQRAALGTRLPEYRALAGEDRVHLVPDAAHWLAHESPEAVFETVNRMVSTGAGKISHL